MVIIVTLLTGGGHPATVRRSSNLPPPSSDGFPQSFDVRGLSLDRRAAASASSGKGKEPRGKPIHSQYGGETGRDDRFIINDKNA